MSLTANSQPSNAPVMSSGEPADGTLTPGNSRQSQTKRNRIQLSCTHCRHAKLKCDREKPCSQCIKKGRASLCSFPEPSKRKKPAVSMQNRLKHLESLVKGVMTSQDLSGSHSSSITNPRAMDSLADEQLFQNLTKIATGFKETPAPPHEKDGLSNSSGQVVLGPNESTYVGATHWAAILDDIEEVKSYFNEVEPEDALRDESVRPDMSLIFNSQSSATKDDLLAALPERPVVDRLVYRYFNSNSPALHIIHKPTFQKEYRKFWADPSGTPISWLGLLYSLMCLATFAAYGAGEENPDARGTPMEMIRTYRGCCAQCLVLSNYAQPGPYTLETFLIYMEGEFVLSKDDQMNCYLVIGVAVRLAMRMGLHRDSDIVAGNISPFQGEMRRRIWNLMFQIDQLVSFHIGLPAMVQAIESDTRFPRNLRDQDFDEDTIELPPSRPETEMTNMSYTISKGHICKVFGKVAAQANRLALPEYYEVMNLDQLLNHAFSQVPSFLRVVPMELSITDSPELIIQRLSLALLFHKTRCVLHRKYLMKERENHEFSYSKKAGIDASMELLFIQSEVNDAVQPGGPLSKDLWFVSSLSMHDFLLAAMIVYLSIVQESNSTEVKTDPPPAPTKQQQEMLKALERSHRNWAQMRSFSVDAKKAYEVLGIMVRRVNSVLRRNNRDGRPEPELNRLGGYHGSDVISGLSLNDPISSAEIQTGIFDPLGGGRFRSSDDTTPSSGLAIQLNLDSVTIPMDSLGAMVDMPTNFDWDVFDNHVRPQQLSDQTWPDLSFETFEFGNNYDYNL